MSLDAGVHIFFSIIPHLRARRPSNPPSNLPPSPFVLEFHIGGGTAHVKERWYIVY